MLRHTSETTNAMCKQLHCGEFLHTNYQGTFFRFEPHANGFLQNRRSLPILNASTFSAAGLQKQKEQKASCQEKSWQRIHQSCVVSYRKMEATVPTHQMIFRGQCTKVVNYSSSLKLQNNKTFLKTKTKNIKLRVSLSGVIYYPPSDKSYMLNHFKMRDLKHERTMTIDKI